MHALYAALITLEPLRIERGRCSFTEPVCPEIARRVMIATIAKLTEAEPLEIHLVIRSTVEEQKALKTP